MNSQLTKAEKILAVVATIAIIAFFGFFTLLSKNSGSQRFNFITDSGINYKMARPDQAFSEYTLEGRELDQIYEGLTPEQKKKAVIKKKEAAKAKVEAKKKADDKKKQSLAKQKQAKAAQTLAYNQYRQNLIKKQSENQRLQKSNNNEVNPAYFAPPSGSDAGAADTTVPKEKAKKTYAEWRAIIFASPSSETLGQFVMAFRKGEVTATELQAMATDLLDQENADFKGLGLALLRSVPSLQSLSQLVHEQPNLPASYQTYVDSALVAYFYPQNITYLRSALQTRDPVLQAKVLSLLQTNLPKIAQNDLSIFVDSRSRGAVSEVNVTIDNFVTLVPALTALTTGQVQPDLAGIAQQVLTYIQSNNNVAQN